MLLFRGGGVGFSLLNVAVLVWVVYVCVLCIVGFNVFRLFRG